MAINHALASAPVSPCTAHFVDCMRRADHVATPYDHWILDDVLPEQVIDGVASLPFAPPQVTVFDGRRESNNSTRVYFSPDNQDRFPVCRDVVETFSDPAVIDLLQRQTKSDLSTGHLRVEYCQDVDGFWLEPHLDITVKLFTMLVYLSDDPALADAGTDIYDDTPEHKPAGRSAYAKNKGLIFIPGVNTWHGFTPRPIVGVRKSIIINYVSDAWRNKGELAYR